MKLFIINGENNDERIEIQINDYMMVKDIKHKLDEIFNGNGNFKKNSYKLIHKNIILFDDNTIKYYKIFENDEIWFGQIENYLKKNDVIVYVFHWGRLRAGEYLVVKINDTISTIRSMIDRYHSEIINIWNVDGKEMKNDQIISEINNNENYKLIIRCDDGAGNVINNTFEHCCYLYDRYYLDQYLFSDTIRDNNKNNFTRIILINRIMKIRQILSLNDIIDDRLNQNLSDLPSSFLNMTNFFCIEWTDRILNICFEYWRFVMNQFDDNVMKILNQYCQFAILAALWNYSNFRQCNNTKIRKTLISIVIDALDYFLKYLVDTSNDWQYWLRLWTSQYLLFTTFDNSDVNDRIGECTVDKFTIKTRINRKNEDHFITFKPGTVIKAKQSISKVLNVDIRHLYCIKPGGDDKPNDEDLFDGEFIIEVVLSMDDVEILRSLGEGGFAKIYLCRDKISNTQFALKKSIQNDKGLYRDINIYSKLNTSRNIMSYSGLFNDGENICIGMEYMSGGSLRSYLDKVKYLTEQEIEKISYEILTQLNELHKLGIIHRDIKSDNIVFDKLNKAKLIDFGLSKFTNGLKSKDLLNKLKKYTPGTYYYMAPDLVKKEIYSEKIDIWSFGMVMVEMVTTKRPFHWLKPFQAVIKIRDCKKYEFEPIFSISNCLNRFINSCLNTNPNERPSAEQLIKSEFIANYLKKI